MKALYFDNSLPKIVALKAASIIDKYAALGPISPLRYAEIPEPELPNPRWLKVKNLCCGLCGTDLHFMFMDMDPRCFPAGLPGISRKYLGHELVGEVVEVGDEVHEVRTGDRVALRIDWPSCFQMEIDPPCGQCATGNYMLCENLGAKSPPLRDVGGGFSPFMVLHRSQPFRIPDGLDQDRAVMLEPTATVMHMIQKRLPQAGEKVLVFGAGTIGLMAVAVAKAVEPGAHVSCIARHPFQAKAAKRMGADSVLSDKSDLYEQIAQATGAALHRGNLGNRILLGGFDAIFDTIGNDASIHNALRWVRGGGDVVVIGINFKPGKIDYTPIWNQEITLTGINSHATDSSGQTSFDLAADLLADAAFPATELITHRFPVHQYKKAVRTFLDKRRTGAIKIVMDHES